MTGWTSGYIADVNYVFDYCHELNPLRAHFAMLNAGVLPPGLGTHCELGFGQGISVNIHAAASEAKWWATDFNPAHACFAQRLAAVSGAQAHLFDQSFVDFCVRKDLPQFDSIGLHGIWSWISDENRQVIVDFVGRQLKVGGVLYISYNSHPGWTTMMPMRHLLAQHTELMGSPGQGTVVRIEAALNFAEKLLAIDPAYGRANPQMLERIEKIKKQNRNYVAHEYFNRDWHPMHFADMAKWLAPAKLTFVCSAHYTDNIDTLNLTPDQQALLKEIPDPVFREEIRDFCVNQQFRCDFWVKGAYYLNGMEQQDALRKQRVVLCKPRTDVSLKVNGRRGEATMQEAIYGPILDVLADHRPKSIKDIELAVEGQVSFGQITEAIMVLIGNGVLHAAQDELNISQARACSDRLNRFIIDKARCCDDISYLASPVTGGGIMLGRFQQLFVLASSHGKATPQELAVFAWELLSAQGQRIMKEGNQLETPEQNLAELTEQAVTFASKQLPVLKALQIM